jgi:hypothetical protein
MLDFYFFRYICFLGLLFTTTPPLHTTEKNKLEAPNFWGPVMQHWLHLLITGPVINTLRLLSLCIYVSSSHSSSLWWFWLAFKLFWIEWMFSVDQKKMCWWLKIIKMPYHIIGLGFLTFQFTFDFSFFPCI